MASSEDPNRAAFEQMFTGAADAIAGLDTGYHAELGISALIGGVYQLALPPRRVGVTNFAEPFTRHVARKRSRKACAVLAGLGAVAPEPAATLAGDALRRLAGNGVAAPAWATGAGQVRCTTALASQNMWGDKTQYLALFEYDSGAVGPDHLVVVTVDHASGQVDELGVLAPGRSALAGVRESADEYLTLTPVDPAALRADVAEAIGRTDAAPELRGPEYVSQWAFVLARALALPAGGQPRRGMPEPERDRLVREFIDGPGSELALARSLDSAVIVAGTRLLIDWAVDAGNRDPLKWSPTAVETFLLGWMPAQTGVRPEVASWLPEILTAFIEYAGVRRGLPPETVLVVRSKVGELSRAYTEKMLGEGSQGSMDDVLTQLLAAGVDPDDDAAVRGWLEQHVQRSDQDGRSTGERP